MTTITLRGKEYKLGNFSSLHLFSLAQFIGSLSNGNDTIEQWNKNAKLLKFLVPDISDDLVSIEIDMGIFLGIEELKELYLKSLTFLQSKEKGLDTLDIQSLAKTSEKSELIKSLEIQLNMLKDQ
jgi:hypothetical protein